MKFSIIIPTYNRADRIIKTIESVLNQSYKDFEIIVIDDASTDNTIEILKPYVDHNSIKLIAHVRNMERCNSRNHGMASATGDFVTFLDSDDLMYENCLKDAARFVEENRSIDFFHNIVHLVDDSGKELHKFVPPSTKDKLKAISLGNYLGCSGVFISRSIYSKYQFNVSLGVSSGEDWHFWLTIMPYFEIGRLNKLNSAAVQHVERSVSTKSLNRILFCQIKVISNILEDKNLSLYYLPYRKILYSSAYYYSATCAIDKRESKKAFLFLFKSMVVNPIGIFQIRTIKVFLIAFWGLFGINIIKIKNKYN